MDLDQEWLLKTADKFYLEEEKKVEKEFLYKIKFMSILLKTLTKRVDFVKVAKAGNKSFTKGFILQKYKRILLPKTNESMPRIGFVVTKKIGGAVIRNRIKRRLRSITKEVLNNYGKKNYDYVIVANKKSLKMNYTELKQDLLKVIK